MKEKLLNRDGNIVAKAEITHYEPFPHLAQGFKKSSAADGSKSFVTGKDLNSHYNTSNLYKYMYNIFRVS